MAKKTIAALLRKSKKETKSLRGTEMDKLIDEIYADDEKYPRGKKKTRMTNDKKKEGGY